MSRIGKVKKAALWAPLDWDHRRQKVKDGEVAWQKTGTLSPQIESTSPEFTRQPGTSFLVHLVGVWCCFNCSQLKGTPYPKSRNSQMKASVRETHTSISPQSTTVETRKHYATTPRKECHQATGKQTTTEAQGVGPWATEWFRKGSWLGLDFLLAQGQGRAGWGGATAWVPVVPRAWSIGFLTSTVGLIQCVQVRQRQIGNEHKGNHSLENHL